LQVRVDRDPTYPNNCHGFAEEGLADLHVGQQVVVTDGSGATVALGMLKSCKFALLESPGQARAILFAFVVPDVPEDPFVNVKIGPSGRGAIAYSLAELQQREWKIHLTL
jgi:hypothetical protein